MVFSKNSLLAWPVDWALGMAFCSESPNPSGDVLNFNFSTSVATEVTHDLGQLGGVWDA